MTSIYSILRNFIREKYRQRRAKDIARSILRDLPRDSAHMEAVKQDLASFSMKLNLMKEGHRQRRAKDFASAIASYTQAIQLDSTHVDAYIGRARAYIGNEEFESAKQDLLEVIAYYNTAISRYAYGMSYFFHRGMAFANLGKNSEAIADIEKYIDLNQNYFRNSFPVIEKAGPILIQTIKEASVQNQIDWYETWEQIKYQASPIDSLILDLWDDDYDKQDEAVAELGRIGEPALPALLVALEKDDRNFETSEYENGTLKKAILAIGQPAILALAKNLTNTSGRLPRAAAKTLHLSKDPLAEQILREALDNPNVREYIKQYYIRDIFDSNERWKKRGR